MLVGCNSVFGLDETRLVPPGDGGADAPRPDGEPAGCPASYDFILQTTASRYRLVTSTTPFAEAAADCADDAAGLTHLLVLSNEAERSALITLPPKYLVDDTWIGATAPAGTTAYRWITAEDTAGYVVPAGLGTAPWEGDQPDNPGGCGELRALSGSLHDEGCDSSSNYICECDGFADDPTRY